MVSPDLGQWAAKGVANVDVLDGGGGEAGTRGSRGRGAFQVLHGAWDVEQAHGNDAPKPGQQFTLAYPRTSQL